MGTFRRLAKPVGRVVVLSLLALNPYLPAAHAGMIGTEAMVDTAQVRQDRERLHNALDRDDVKAQLRARGADPKQIQARVDSLTDEETHSLASNLDQLPAGGDGLIGALVFIFIVLLITDLLGLTHIFPFVSHNR